MRYSYSECNAHVVIECAVDICKLTSCLQLELPLANDSTFYGSVQGV